MSKDLPKSRLEKATTTAEKLLGLAQGAIYILVAYALIALVNPEYTINGGQNGENPLLSGVVETKLTQLIDLFVSATHEQLESEALKILAESIVAKIPASCDSIQLLGKPIWPCQLNPLGEKLGELQVCALFYLAGVYPSVPTNFPGLPLGQVGRNIAGLLWGLMKAPDAISDYTPGDQEPTTESGYDCEGELSPAARQEEEDRRMNYMS